jgi:hypothetical protein
VLVAGWPPVALLLAVELLAHHPASVSSAPPVESEQAAVEPESPPGLDMISMAETGQTELAGETITLVHRRTAAASHRRWRRSCGLTTGASARPAGHRPAPNWIG